MKRAIFTALFVICAGLPAFSAELEFSANGEVEYDDNVFRREENKEDDLLFRLRPGVRVREERGDDLNFSVGYEAPIEFSLENSKELNEVDHLGDGKFNYHVNDRVELFGSDRYGYIRSTLRAEGVDTDALSEQGFPQFTDERDRIKINDATLGGIYRFSPRTLARMQVISTFFDSSRDDRARVYSVGAMADTQYRLTQQHQIGGGAGYIYQDFDDRTDIPGSQTNIYRVFGTWRWVISETLQLDLNAGPAYLETQQDDAARGRVESSIPFTLLKDAAVVTGFFDENGNPLPAGTALAPGSVLVPSFNTVGGGLNCGVVNGIVVSSCNPNIALDAVSDAALVSNVVNNNVGVTNINPNGERDDEVTGFVEMNLGKRWTPTLATGLRYAREQGDASGLGGTVIQDAFSISNTWDFFERWQLAVRGDYVIRESAFDIAQTYDVVTGSPIPGGNPAVPVATRTGTSFNSSRNVEVDSDRWGVAGRITHALFKSTSIFVQVRYDEQTSKDDSLGETSDFENFLATFGVRHVFEPIPLW